MSIFNTVDLNRYLEGNSAIKTKISLHMCTLTPPHCAGQQAVSGLAWNKPSREGAW